MQDIQDNIVALNDVVRTRIEKMMLTDKWKYFLGHLPTHQQFNIQVVGARGDGKSTATLGLAKEFARHGDVLYFAAEEKIMSGTLRIRAQYNQVRADNIFFCESRSVRVLESHLATGLYRFCFVDSVNMLEESDEAILPLMGKYPAISFIFISQVNAEGIARGSKLLGHAVDIVLRAKREGDDSRWLITEKNRYGNTQDRFFIFKPRALATVAAKRKSKMLTFSEIEQKRLIRTAGRTGSD